MRCQAGQRQRLTGTRQHNPRRRVPDHRRHDRQCPHRINRRADDRSEHTEQLGVRVGETARGVAVQREYAQIATVRAEEMHPDGVPEARRPQVLRPTETPRPERQIPQPRRPPPLYPHLFYLRQGPGPVEVRPRPVVVSVLDQGQMPATLRVEQPDPGTLERDHPTQRLQQRRGTLADRAGG